MKSQSHQKETTKAKRRAKKTIEKSKNPVDWWFAEDMMHEYFSVSRKYSGVGRNSERVPRSGRRRRLQY